ncbi:SET domain-containing protein [Candidatus Kaiserbacteria bacterium]|nr:SET domain-containing protein [Candidatus Kaiserbacteria bacterium]
MTSRKASVKKTQADPRFVVRKAASGSGHGLFATVPIKKGDFILEYTGKKIPTDVADALTTRYLFHINDTWTIDGSPRSNVARYINHGCDPNCEVEMDGERLMIYAIKNIAKGEELSFDYGAEYYDEFIKPGGCKCMAKTHR